MATVTTRIGLADHGRKMTMEEFLEAEAKAGYRYELARGVLEVTQVPGPHMVKSLATFIRSWQTIDWPILE